MRQLDRADPNAALAAGAALVVGLEALYREHTSLVWVALQLLAAAFALVVAWRGQDRLRLVPVLVTVAAFQAALVGVHALTDVVADKDSSVVYRWQGNTVVRGEYPRSEYPVGAVLLFALEAWVGGGTTRWANAVFMVPFGVACAAAVWALRTVYAPWLAAVIGLWPANLFYWQYKFDLVPAALLAVGLVLALRGRWAGAGIALGVGTAVKWSPALAAVVLAAGLLGSRRVRAAGRHALAFTVTLAAIHLPLLLWRPSEVAAAYERQSGRSITPESVWYLLLRPIDLAHVRTHISFSAGAPHWADVAASALQVGLLVALALAAAFVRRGPAVVAIAALAPALFLLTNRIFSPQFVLVAFVAWAVAAALLVRDRREQLVVGAGLIVASVGNMFVYPYALPFYDVTWVLMSLSLFTVGLALTAALALRAVRTGA